MLVSPLMFFPLLYVVLAAAMAYGALGRWRAQRIPGWQLALSLVLKLVPIAAFTYAWWWSTTTRDDIGAYLMFGATAVAASVLGVAWFFFDLLGLGVWRKDAGPPPQTKPQERSPGKPAARAKPRPKGVPKRPSRR